MTEKGIITRVEGDYATVRLFKKAECSKCGLCMFSDGVSHIDLTAKNGIQAQVDDEVIIENNENAKFLGIVLVFLVPLILIVLSVVTSLLVIKKELFSLIFSLGSVVIWFIILSVIDKKIKNNKKMSVNIIKKIKDNQDTGEKQ